MRQLFFRLNRLLRQMVLFGSGFIVLGTAQASAMTADDFYHIYYHTPSYSAIVNDCTESASAVKTAASVSGANVKSGFIHLTNNGYSAAQAAGLIGNFQWESSPDLDPTTENGIGAYGIAQWLGDRQTNMRIWTAANGGTDSFDAQIRFVVYELNGDESAAKAKILETDTATDAALAVMQYYERPGNDGSQRDRIKNANDVFDKYSKLAGESSGITNSSYTPAGCPSTSNTSSPDCLNAEGTAKILCEAEKYNPVSYLEDSIAGHQGGEAWHKTCPTIDASCVLDCSGLVSVAVYDAFGNGKSWTTSTFLGDTSNWTEISASQARAGDLVIVEGGSHVEIIDHFQGNTIHTFGAHNSHVPQPQQVGPSSYYTRSNVVHYLRYVGKGAEASV
ncbi:hypothetical protein KDA23_06845 [Candidatus Saccharibacteria bacterium]|nr:hypothetical protein [Candidatus Saccharibacteria bacterium]